MLFTFIFNLPLSYFASFVYYDHKIIFTPRIKEYDTSLKGPAIVDFNIFTYSHRLTMRSLASIALVLTLAAVAIHAQFRFSGNGGNFFNSFTNSGRTFSPARQGGFRQGGGCTPTINYQSRGRNFWVSWRTCPTEFRGDQVSGICASGGMRPVSLNDPSLAQEFMNLCAAERQKWFWTGGHVSGQTISWPNGITQSANQLRSLFSTTGG